jgi:hypothetical protein
MAFGLFTKPMLEPAAPAIQQPWRLGPPDADATPEANSDGDGEIDVPIRVRGRHWGGIRTAYKL